MPVKVFVGNLPEKASQEALRDLFSPYGDITELTVIKNYAFVIFSNKQDADNSIKDLHKTKMLGNTLIVQIANNQGDKNNQRKDGFRSSTPNQNERPPPRRNCPTGNNSQRNGTDRTPPKVRPPGTGNRLDVTPNEETNPLVFSAVNTLAAIENQLRKTDIQMDNIDYHRDSPHSAPDRERSSNADYRNDDRQDICSGYVIYERYFIDPSHPLLRGLPVPKMTRMTDSYVVPR